MPHKIAVIEAVRNLQRVLDVPQDGIFGWVTEMALREHQASYNLPADFWPKGAEPPMVKTNNGWCRPEDVEPI